MLAYATIAGCGFVILALSYLLGDHGDAGGFDHADVPSPFSMKVLAVFCGIFGAVGAACRIYELSHPVSIAAGSVCGALAGGGAYALIRLLHGSQSSTDLSEGSLVGRDGTVVVAIPAGGPGQVSLSVGVQTVTRIAQSANGQPIAQGAVVTVERRAGETLIVKPLG